MFINIQYNNNNMKSDIIIRRSNRSTPPPDDVCSWCIYSRYPLHAHRIMIIICISIQYIGIKLLFQSIVFSLFFFRSYFVSSTVMDSVYNSCDARVMTRYIIIYQCINCVIDKKHV